MKEVTCNKCGWVHFEMDLTSVLESINDFNTMYNLLTKEKQEQYYGGNKATMDSYTHCTNCGNSYKDFRPAVEADAAAGVTLQPILDSTEIE